MLTEKNKKINKIHSEFLLEINNLKIKGLSEKGWLEIVRGVDLKLKRGEILGLIGE